MQIEEILNQLVDELSLVLEFIANNNLINQNTAKRTNNIRNYYRDLTNGQVDIINYNFKNIKRDVNSLIHPDVVTSEIKNQANNFSSKINGYLDDVLKFQKESLRNGQNSYFWNYTPKKEEVADEPDVTEHQSFNVIRSIFGRKVPKDYIPKNQQEYFAIKRYYERQIRVITALNAKRSKLINCKSKKLSELGEVWLIKKSERNIQAVFSSELDSLKNKSRKLSNVIQTLEQKMQSEISKKENIVFRRLQNLTSSYNLLIGLDPKLAEYTFQKEELDNLYYKLVGLKPDIKNTDIYYKISNLLTNINFCDMTYIQFKILLEIIESDTSNLKKGKYANLQFTLSELMAIMKIIYSNFYNEEALHLFAQREIQNMSPKYVRYQNELISNWNEQQGINNDITHYLSHQLQIKEGIRAQIEKEYYTKYQDLLAQISKLRSEYNSSNERLKSIEDEYKKFIISYQDTYEAKARGQMS